MLDLTFGEQVKIILSRKGMTIKELAEKIEKETGKKMSRQNLTQRLGRDNFQEQDMRMIAQILGCPFYLDILEEHEGHEETEEEDRQIENLRHKKEAGNAVEHAAEIAEKREQIQTELDEKADSDYVQETLFDYVWDKNAKDMQTTNVTEEGDSVEASVPENAAKQEDVKDDNSGQEEKKKAHGWRAFFERYIKHEEPEMEDTYEPETVETAETDKNEDTEAVDAADAVSADESSYIEDPDDGMFTAGEEDLSIGELNPYTGHEYESNSVRMNKKRIGYVQVYDRGKHQWTDMTEWAFLGYQERKKALLGKDYVPPIYLD